MSGLSPRFDLDAQVKPQLASPAATGAAGAVIITAAGAGDNTAVTGNSIDRQGYMSAKYVLSYVASLADGKKLSIAAEYQESSDNSTWDTAVALQASTLADTGGAGGSKEAGMLEFDLNLKGKKRYIRFNFTPDLDAGATDTAALIGVALLGGRDVLPVP